MASKPSVAGQGLGLFTDLVEGVRKGIKSRGGDDSHLEGLRRADVIEAMVAMIMAPVQAVLQFLDRTVLIRMDLSKTMTQLIADGKYDWVNGDISKKFSIQSEAGIRIIEVCLLHYNKRMTSGEVLADMERQGLRPATFLELLWIGIQHSALQLEFPIVALGTVVELGGGRRVAYLDRDGRVRRLSLDWFGSDGWLGYYRFAAVRK